jgi:hypothetical protein
MTHLEYRAMTGAADSSLVRAAVAKGGGGVVDEAVLTQCSARVQRLFNQWRQIMDEIS